MITDLVARLLGRIREHRRHIVVIGDVMVDRWVHGHMSQCQDGCHKFVQESMVETPGGAANAERCLTEWGVNTALYGYAMNDCPIKCRYVEDNRIVFRADYNDGPGKKGYRWAYQLSLEMVQCASGVLLSDYDKGFLTPEFIREVVGICCQSNIPCVADCKRGPEVYKGCIRKGNLDWYTNYGKADVATRGSDSPIVSGGSLRYSAPNVECVNHVGAGDCFAAHLTLALAYGFPLREAAILAHGAGRVYVQSPHNRPPTPTEISVDLCAWVEL